jgi:hypothetical protein
MQAFFQFIIVTMILSASGIAGLVATLFMRAPTFSKAAQLRLRLSSVGLCNVTTGKRCTLASFSMRHVVLPEQQ